MRQRWIKLLKLSLKHRILLAGRQSGRMAAIMEKLMKTTLELYNGEVKLEFDSFRHVYTLLPEGRKIPSVTTILSVINKPALISWSANMAVDYVQANLRPGQSLDELHINSLLKEARIAHTKRRDETADLGSIVHSWISQYIKGEKPEMPINQQLQDSINNFLTWQKEHDVKFILSEQPVFSKVHGYCGTLDFVAEIGKELFLGDIKTSNAIYDEHWIQLSSYGIARQEEFPIEKYKHQGIIRIGRDGSFEFKMANNIDKCFEAFLHAKGLWEWQQFMKEEYFKEKERKNEA